jgi:hypothetical protein
MDYNPSQSIQSMVLSFLESIINPKFLYTIRGLSIEHLLFRGLLLDDHRDVCPAMRINI